MSTEARATLETHYRRTLQRGLDGFGQLREQDWAASRRGAQWTAKDYLAHLVASQEHEANPITEQALAGGKPTVEDFRGPQEIDAYNARIIETVRHLSPAELLERMRTAFGTHLCLLEGASDEDLARPFEHPGWYRPGTVAHVFYTGYLHIPLHYQDIRSSIRARRQLPHWMETSTDEEVHDILARTFDYMPLMYSPERGGDLKATILFSMTGPGGGNWTIDIAGGECRCLEGRPERASMELSTGPADWVDLMTKDLNPVWGFLSRRIRIKGNFLLALKMDRLFQVT